MDHTQRPTDLLTSKIQTTKRPPNEEERLPSITDCDEELHALLDLQKQEEYRIIMISNRRNDLILTGDRINTLPVELFVKIIHLVVHSTGEEPNAGVNSRGGLKALSDLGLVCRRWNKVINSTPILWSRIVKDNGTGIRFVQRALERSHDTPLDIIYTWQRSTANDFWDTIMPHSQRWKKLELHTAYFEALRALESISAPLLEELHGNAGSDLSEARRPINIFGNRTLQILQRVQLCGIPIILEPISHSLTHITHLTISRLERHPISCPSINGLLTTISASPALQHLELTYIAFGGGADPLPPSRSVHLPVLTNLRLEFLKPRQIIHVIMASVWAPNCASARIESSFDQDQHPLESFFTPEISHYFHRICSRWTIPWISINLFTGEKYIEFLETRWRVSVPVQDIPRAMETLLWMKARPECQSWPLRYALEVTGGDGREVNQILTDQQNDLETLHTIELFEVSGLREILTLLGTKHSTSYGKTGWRFPALKGICLADAMEERGDWDAIQRLLRSRCTDPPGGSIRLLTFGYSAHFNEEMVENFSTYYWPTYLQPIRAILGPKGKLFWFGHWVTQDGDLEAGERLDFLEYEFDD